MRSTLSVTGLGHFDWVEVGLVGERSRFERYKTQHSKFILRQFGRQTQYLLCMMAVLLEKFFPSLQFG